MMFTFQTCHRVNVKPLTNIQSFNVTSRPHHGAGVTRVYLAFSKIHGLLEDMHAGLACNLQIISSGDHQYHDNYSAKPCSAASAVFSKNRSQASWTICS